MKHLNTRLVPNTKTLFIAQGCAYGNVYFPGKQNKFPVEQVTMKLSRR